MPTPEPSVPPDEDRSSAELHIVARHIKPGDYLPPQPALDGTGHQDAGFTVGDEGRDVLPGLAVTLGRMLLFGPAGALDSVGHDVEVAVRRRSSGQLRPHSCGEAA